MLFSRRDRGIGLCENNRHDKPFGEAIRVKMPIGLFIVERCKALTLDTPTA